MNRASSGYGTTRPKRSSDTLPAEALGHSVELVIPDSLQAAHHAWYATAERRPGCSRANEATVPARCRDGQTIQIRGNITVLQDRSGRVTGAALIVRLADELP